MDVDRMSNETDRDTYAKIVIKNINSSKEIRKYISDNGGIHIATDFGVLFIYVSNIASHFDSYDYDSYKYIIINQLTMDDSYKCHTDVMKTKRRK